MKIFAEPLVCLCREALRLPIDHRPKPRDLLLIYLLFFLSGISGLIYQVVWVRVFGNVFGNTIYSASIVVAVFMLGLGVGSYVVGAWADRRYARLRSFELRRGSPEPRSDAGAQPHSLLRVYGTFEIVIAAMGLAIAAVLPHLGAVSALVSSYVREPSGWFALSTSSYLARAGIAVALLTPITLLMGGTLTLLIRHLVRTDLEIGGWRVAVLYGINTAGAALGAVVTDFALVPAAGLWGTQMVAVFFNALAGVGAWYLARTRRSTTVQPVRLKPDTTTDKKRQKGATECTSSGFSRTARVRSVRLQPDHADAPTVALQSDDAADHDSTNGTRAVVLTSVALAMTGLASLGMEILWFRHFNILLGGFRAVFSLLLALILVGIGAGSFIGGAVFRRSGRPAEWLMIAQGLFVASTLFGFAAADVNVINNDPAGRAPGSLAAGRHDARGRGAGGNLVQREADACRDPDSGIAHGFQLPARQRGDPARGAVGRPARGRVVSRQHRRCRVRQPGRGFRAAADARACRRARPS